MTTTAPATESTEADGESLAAHGTPSSTPKSGSDGGPPEPPPSAGAPTEPAKPARRPRPPRRPMVFEAKLLSEAFLIVCVGLVSFVVFLLVVAPIQQNNDQDRLYNQLREQLALATAPTGGVIDPGSPVALLTIPGLNLNQVVIEGTSSGDMQAGPGHQRNSRLPGQPGLSVIYGKAETFGAPFQQIGRLREGDRVNVTTGEGSFTFRVRGVRRDGDPVAPNLKKGESRLTMVTSDGPNLLQHGASLFVDADLIDQPQPAPNGMPKLIPPEEKAMAKDIPSANMGLVLWLQALLLALGGIVWARHRWGRREALLVGIPVVLAVVWNIDETVAQLLPNLL